MEYTPGGAKRSEMFRWMLDDVWRESGEPSLRQMRDMVTAALAKEPGPTGKERIMFDFIVRTINDNDFPVNWLYDYLPRKPSAEERLIMQRAHEMAEAFLKQIDL